MHLDLAELFGAAAGGDLDVGGDADPELDRVAALAARRLIAAQRVVLDCLGRRPQRL